MSASTHLLPDVLTDVLIVGAGPVGLSLALELARRGIRFRLIDQSAGPSTTSKAVGVHARTMEIFETLGLAERMISEGVIVRHGSFHLEGGKLLELSFGELSTMYPYVLCLPQSVTEGILIDELERLGARVERNTRLESFEQASEGVHALVAGADGERHIASRFLVGCDGAHSTVRHALGLEFHGAPYPEQLILADVKVETPLSREAMHLFFHSDGLVAWFPLPSGRFRIIADVSKRYPDAPDRIPSPTMEEFQQIVSQRVSTPATLSDPAWLASFRVHHRKVSQYRQGRVFVAGDAAHIHSPAGGQGMNTGIQDAVNLAWKLALAVQGKATEDLLDSYSAEREPIARAVLALSDRMTKVAMATGVGAAVRDVALPLLAGLHAVQSKMIREISQLVVNYRGSSIVGEDWHGHDVELKPGDRAPWVEPVSTPGFQLLIFPGETGDAHGLTEMLSALQPSLGATVVVTRHPYTAWNGETAVDDEDGSIARRYGVHGTCAWLIRPDGYIAWRCSPLSPAGVRHNLALSVNGIL